MRYKHNIIEEKWQSYWDQHSSFTVEPDCTKQGKKCYYVLPMFPYPSGQLHVGHSRNYTFADIVARFKRANGYYVLHTMGWDAFGLPAENAAIQHHTSPKDWTLSNIASMKVQLKRLGYSYDWSREINTCDPEYFRHEQEMFLSFLENGLAYQKESTVNWDPVDETVLANEQVVDGRGWRSGAIVERRSLKQWFFKITEFADELLDGLQHLSGWPEKVRLMQHNWIGRSEGAIVNFRICHSAIDNDARDVNAHDKPNRIDTITIYTTRPETIFGATFIAIAYNHPIVATLQTSPELEAFITQCMQSSVSEKEAEHAVKFGYNTGMRVFHPFNKEKVLPIYITNFVLGEYGTGAIFACPAHDERDHAFATKYSLPIKQVIRASSEYTTMVDVYKEAFTGDGILVNSNFLDGLTVTEAKKAVIAKLEALGIGYGKVNYRLRDWGVSRQRYWGTPIPIVHCPKCGTVAVPRQDLPVVLPADTDFTQHGNPLANHPTWKYVQCPICHTHAERETDTFDTFVESSWYFARFCAPQSTHAIDKTSSKHWLPVNQYIGGIEHAVLHLLYARFFTKALRKCKYWDISEPFEKLLTQGMVCHASYRDHDGQWLYPSEVEKKGDRYYNRITHTEVQCHGLEKMSKSKKNVVTLDEIISKYGADAARMFIVSDSPPERDVEWTERGIDSVYKYLAKLYDFVLEISPSLKSNVADHLTNATTTHCEDDIELKKATHRAIYNVTQSLEVVQFNKAVAHIYTLSNAIYKSRNLTTQRFSISILLQLMNPIAPHITEELWEIMHHDKKVQTISHTNWPVPDPQLLDTDTMTIAVQVNGKLRDTIIVSSTMNSTEVEAIATHTPKVLQHINGKKITKVIYIPSKIINFVCI